MSKETLLTPEVAEMLGYSRSSITRKLKAGTLPIPYRHHHNPACFRGWYEFDRADVEAYLAKQQEQEGESNAP